MSYVISTLLIPSTTSISPAPLIEAVLSSGVAIITAFVVSTGSVALYSVISELNSGDKLVPSTDKDPKLLFLL